VSLSLPWLREGSELAAPVRSAAAGLARLAPLGPLLTLTLVTGLVFWRDLFGGQAYYGADTLAFYYPLTVWYAEQLRAGHLPLWFPLMFGGYPLFADGEVGMLYPLHLLAYGLLPPDLAFAWLRPIHFWLAGLFSYLFARVLEQRRFGATLAALTFSYGSFLVGHLQHENIVRSAVWLPLALLLLELAFRRRGPARLGWLAACGLVLAVQMLGVHVQPVLLTLLSLSAYALFAPLAGPRARQGWLHGGWRALPRPDWPALPAFLLGRTSAVVGCALIGLSLAAVQLLPLYQLGERSARSASASYEFSTSYSIPPVQLLQLVLPYLFRPDQSAYWGLWSAAETTLYLGVAPLLLALVAVAYLRTRAVAVLGLAAGLSLALALGDYLPVNLYGLIWSLPGFSVLRVPARFTLLTVLAGGLLAGFAADWLAGKTFNRQAHPWVRPRLRRLLAILLAFAVGALGLAATFVLLRELLALDSGGTRRAIETLYLSLRRGDLGLTATAVYVGMLRSLDLGNPRTVGGLVLMLAAAALLALRALHFMPRRLWQAALLGLVVTDLSIFAQGFYPQRPTEALRLSLPSVRFLAEHNGLHRVFAEPQLFGLLGPNQLNAWSIDFAGGYSSLEPGRATDYWWSVVRQDNLLLDLYNVRYVLAPRSVPALLAFDGTLFHPADRLMRGSVGNPSGAERFSFGPWWTRAVTVVGSFDPDGELEPERPLAELTLRGPGGEQRVVLHTRDIGLAAAPPPALRAGQQAPKVVWSGPSLQPPGATTWLYGVTLPLEAPLLADELTIQRVGPAGVLNVHGLGLHDRVGLPSRSLMPSDRAKYRLVYEDDDLKILENTAFVPRAFLAAGASQVADGGSLVEHLLGDPLDPRRTVLLEQPPPAGLPPLSDREALPIEVVAHQPEEVRLRLPGGKPGLLVLADRYEAGWRAQVDGREATVYRANGLFRAVAVGPGDREVRFFYDPPAVRVGAAISLVTALGLAVAGGAGRLASGRRRPRRAATAEPGA
jgi:hypothetical protein